MISKMLKKANLSLLLVFLAACASFSEENDMSQEFNGVDPEFSPYVQDLPTSSC